MHVYTHHSAYENLKIDFKNISQKITQLRKEEINQARIERKSRAHQQSERAKKANWKRQELYLRRVKETRPKARALHIYRAYIDNIPFDNVEKNFSMANYNGTFNEVWNIVYKKYKLNSINETLNKNPQSLIGWIQSSNSINKNIILNKLLEIVY